MGLQDAVRWLLPKEDQFFLIMEKQAATITKAATELSQFRPGHGTAGPVSQRVQEIEHEGDSLLHEVEEALAKSFVTPIDREDIQKLGSLLDDVLDRINEAARAMHLYGLDAPTPPMIRLAELLVEASTALATAMPKLRQAAYQGLIDCSREVKRIEKEGDKVFRDAVATLFREDSISAKQLLRDKEILTDLEEALDVCEDVAEFMAHLAVKNG